MSDDLIGDLERLARLRDSGHLTDDEFTAQKARLLGNACPSCGAPLQLDAQGRCIYCHEEAGPFRGMPAAGSPGDANDDAIARANPKNKIAAIKVLREQERLSLRDAKERMDAAYRRIGR